MHFTRWAVTTTLLVAEASFAASSALLYMPSFKRYDNANELMRRTSELYEGDLERRSPQGGDLSLSAPDVERNTSTLTACSTALSTLINFSSEAGIAACYNILDWHANMGGMFQADLRLFQVSPATGAFANVPMNAITVNLAYPNSTQFSTLTNMKRSTVSLQSRDNETNQIQQFSLQGGFKIQIDLSKLNTTELLSLLIPQITLDATSLDGTQITSNLTSDDTVYFVAGQFRDQATPQTAKQAANPAMAVQAISHSKGFVLPGRTFGFFPVGLIVTGAWTFLFILAYGLGTLSRMRHRNIYRKRIAATAGKGAKR